uniref:Transmembrane protein n=1 Tax=Panagrellus redivivus TaxID=6233 RepID=A0A7E4ZY93_PANRE
MSGGNYGLLFRWHETTLNQPNAPGVARMYEAGQHVARGSSPATKVPLPTIALSNPNTTQLISSVIDRRTPRWHSPETPGGIAFCLCFVRLAFVFSTCAAHYIDSVQFFPMEAPSKLKGKLSSWKRIYGLLHYLLIFIMPNEDDTELCLEDDCLNTDWIVCESISSQPSCNIYDQVFITDSDEMYQWASKDTFMFRLLKFLQKFRYLRFFLDGIITVNSCWQSVLRVDEVNSKNEHVDIADTLILHCNSIETYSKVIPRIRGSYNSLILHGHISWDQIKQLIHPDVKQVRINAVFKINPVAKEYEEFINFIIKHCRGMDYKFSIAYEAKCSLDLIKKLRKAFRSHDHTMSLCERGFDIIYDPRILILLLFYPFMAWLPAGIIIFFNYFFMIGDNYGALGMIVCILHIIFVFRLSYVAPADIKDDVVDIDFTNTLKYLNE